MTNRSTKNAVHRGLVRNALRSKSGTSALEFALVAPIFLMLLFGIASFGLYFGTVIALTTAAAEGARASVAGLTSTERATLSVSAAQTAFASYAPYLSPGAMAVQAQPNPQNPNQFSVSVSYDFSNYKALLGMGTMVPGVLQTPSVTMTAANAGFY